MTHQEPCISTEWMSGHKLLYCCQGANDVDALTCLAYAFNSQAHPCLLAPVEL
jgi:hypothetical protein